MSLIPSESYSFPDNFTRTVTCSSPQEKEAAALVEEAPARRKKRFSFSFRRSAASRRKVARETLDLPEGWQESFSAVEEPPAPAANEVVTRPAPSPKLSERPAAPSAKSPVRLHEGTPEPLPSLFKDDLPLQPTRKAKVATQAAVESQPQLPLENGATERKATPKPAPKIVAPPSRNGFVETVMSPEGLGQFFQQIAPMESPATENNVAEPFQPFEPSSQDGFHEASPNVPAESESGSLEVPITPELLAQLFQAMAPTASQVPPENNGVDPFAGPEEPLHFVTPTAPSVPPAQPQIAPANNGADIFAGSEEPPYFATPIASPELAEQPQIAPANNGADIFAGPEEPPYFAAPIASPEPPAQPQILPENNVFDPFAGPEQPPHFAAPIAPPAQPEIVPENNVFDAFACPEEPPHFAAPIAPPVPPAQPQMSVEEFFQPGQLPLQPQTSAEEFFQPRKLPPQPRRASIPSKAPQNSIPIAPPEPQIRRSSVPPSLKRKVRWNRRAPQDQSVPLAPSNAPQNYLPTNPAVAGVPPGTIVPQEWQEWQPPAPDFSPVFAPGVAEPPLSSQMFEPVQPPSPDLQPVPSRERGKQAPRPAGHNSSASNQVVPFETRILAQRDYVEKRRRSMKLHRFILWESIAAGFFMPLAILGLFRAFSDPALVVIVDSLAIAVAAAAVVIPIFFFAIPSRFPGEESDLGL